jgi:hypothetical protein
VARYGNEVMALPLGEKPLMVNWRGEIPEKLPTTWGQADEIKVGRESDGNLLQEFIARVVAATEPGDRAGLFFAEQTMDAELTHSQIVESLEKMIREQEENRPQVSLAVQVPARKAEKESQLAPLLIADRVYLASLNQWEANDEDTRPPVVCSFSGRLVSVTSTSSNAASAFKLIPWLVGGTNGTQLSQRSDATLWFRASQTPQAGKWLEESDAESWITQSLSRGDAYLLPRIPGIDEYLNILNDAIDDAVASKQPAAEALATAAEKWNRLTDKLGRDSQRMALNRHLGLVE